MELDITLPMAVSRALSVLEACGYEGYAVGGCVRDSLIGFKLGNCIKARLYLIKLCSNISFTYVTNSYDTL